MSTLPTLTAPSTAPSVSSLGVVTLNSLLDRKVKAFTIPTGYREFKYNSKKNCAFSKHPIIRMLQYKERIEYMAEDGDDVSEKRMQRFDRHWEVALSFTFPDQHLLFPGFVCTLVDDFVEINWLDPDPSKGEVQPPSVNEILKFFDEFFNELKASEITAGARHYCT